MLRAVINKIMEEGAARRLALCQTKGADYAQPLDALTNFKQVHEICEILGIDPSARLEDTGFFNIVHKLQRWTNLRDRTPDNETLLDTLDDFHNYADLTYALQIERSNSVQFSEEV